MIDTREERLRARIDTVTDERDQALDERDALQKALRATRAALNEARASRDMWKARALDTQKLLAMAEAKMRLKRAAAV